MAAQTIWEGMVRGKPARLLAEDSTITIEPLTEGVISSIATGVWGFAKAHPFLTTIVGLSAYDAIKKSQDKKTRTVNMYAKDKEQKNNMQAVVDTMVKSGYKIVKQAYKGANGYEWELYRT